MKNRKFKKRKTGKTGKKKTGGASTSSYGSYGVGQDSGAGVDYEAWAKELETLQNDENRKRVVNNFLKQNNVTNVYNGDGSIKDIFNQFNNPILFNMFANYLKTL